MKISKIVSKLMPPDREIQNFFSSFITAFLPYKTRSLHHPSAFSKRPCCYWYLRVLVEKMLKIQLMMKEKPEIS